MNKRIVLLFTIGLLSLLLIGSLAFSNITGRAITTINSCLDSDNGKDFYVKGTAKGVSQDMVFGLEERFSVEDRCVDGNVLLEQYCYNEHIQQYRESERYVCPKGCLEGACNRIDSPYKTSPLSLFKEKFLR